MDPFEFICNFLVFFLVFHRVINRWIFTVKYKSSVRYFFFKKKYSCIDLNSSYWHQSQEYCSFLFYFWLRNIYQRQSWKYP